MPTKDLIILMSVFAFVVFFVLVFFFPSEEKRKRKKRVKDSEKTELLPEEKKWQEAAFQLKERVIKHRQEIEALKKERKDLLRRLQEEQEKSEHLNEKLKREKKWFSEQEANLGKRTQEMRQIKMDLMRVQTDLEKEYSLRLTAEREKRDLKNDFDKMGKEKQEHSLKITNLEFTIRTLKEEIVELKKKNHELSKKREEESQWVAQSEFLKLQQELKDKTTELEKLKEAQK